MRFMNEYDVVDAVRRHAGDPVLGPASRTLSNLVEWANSNSDGWAYWPKPARAAARLMALVERRPGLTHADDATPAEYRAALAPIKTFLTRQGVNYDAVIIPK